jgi:hypothetical protein
MNAMLLIILRDYSEIRRTIHPGGIKKLQGNYANYAPFSVAAGGGMLISLGTASTSNKKPRPEKRGWKERRRNDHLVLLEANTTLITQKATYNTSRTHTNKINQKMKLPPATLLLLSSSIGIVRGILPPGYEGDAYRPPGACLLYTNPGLRGPLSAFYKCHDQTTGETTEAVWTGSKSDIKPPDGWTKNPEQCN